MWRRFSGPSSKPGASTSCPASTRRKRVPSPASPTIADGIISAVFVLVALLVYGLQVRRIRRDGGKVLAAQFDLPELLMSFVFAGFFLFIAFASVQSHQGDKAAPIKIESVLPNSLFF